MFSNPRISTFVVVLIYWRYFYFFIWTHGKEELKTFVEVFSNSMAQPMGLVKRISYFLTFMSLYSMKSCELISILNWTDRHQYQHYSSSHSEHAKRSIVSSQTLWISRLLTKKKDFQQHRFRMKTWSMQLGYPKKLIDNGMGRLFYLRKKGSKIKG